MRAAGCYLYRAGPYVKLCCYLQRSLMVRREQPTGYGYLIPERRVISIITGLSSSFNPGIVPTR